MRLLVIAGKADPQVRGQAVALTRRLPQKDYAGEIAALFDFVQNGIRYTRDVSGWEVLHTPRAVLEIGAGDCDDKSILLAAMLEALDHPTQFIAIGFAPGVLEHVYVEAAWPGTQLTDYPPGRGLALDPTEPQRRGWRPEGATEMLVMPNAEI